MSLDINTLTITNEPRCHIVEMHASAKIAIGVVHRSV